MVSLHCDRHILADLWLHPNVIVIIAILVSLWSKLYHVIAIDHSFRSIATSLLHNELANVKKSNKLSNYLLAHNAISYAFCIRCELNWIAWNSFERRNPGYAFLVALRWRLLPSRVLATKQYRSWGRTSAPDDVVTLLHVGLTKV